MDQIISDTFRKLIALNAVFTYGLQRKDAKTRGTPMILKKEIKI